MGLRIIPARMHGINPARIIQPQGLPTNLSAPTKCKSRCKLTPFLEAMLHCLSSTQACCSLKNNCYRRHHFVDMILPIQHT